MSPREIYSEPEILVSKDQMRVSIGATNYRFQAVPVDGHTCNLCQIPKLSNCNCLPCTKFERRDETSGIFIEERSND